MFENDQNVPAVVNGTGCNKHDADKGRACWEIWTLAGTRLPAVCNRRAVRFGFVGEIDPRSLRKR